MSTAGQTYQIFAGVRRAKAWQLAGAQIVRAQLLDANGKLIAEKEVPLDSLLSPKVTIEMKTARQIWRYERIEKARPARVQCCLPSK